MACVLACAGRFAAPVVAEPPKAKPPRKTLPPVVRHAIHYPPGFDPAYKLTPVLFAFHGTGGNGEQMLQIWQEACDRLGVILVTGRGSSAMGEGWSWSGFEDAGKVIDAAKIEIRKKTKLDTSAPRVLTGFSQGGWATWGLGHQYPTNYRRLIPVCGMWMPRTDAMAKGLTDEDKAKMKRWRVYIMVGVKDIGEMVPNNNWAASQLEMVGAAVWAPFREKRDPSFDLYQDIGHGFPGKDQTERTAELVRALKFVLRGDEQDQANWAKVDPKWRERPWWKDAPEDVPEKAARQTGKPDGKGAARSAGAKKSGGGNSGKAARKATSQPTKSKRPAE